MPASAFFQKSEAPLTTKASVLSAASALAPQAIARPSAAPAKSNLLIMSSHDPCAFHFRRALAHFAAVPADHMVAGGFVILLLRAAHNQFAWPRSTAALRFVKPASARMHRGQSRNAEAATGVMVRATLILSLSKDAPPTM